MFILAIIVTITLTAPDVNYIADIAAGESLGMPQEAVEFVITQIVHDLQALGIDGLRSRWYAPLKRNDEVRRLAWQVLSEPLRRGRCRLIGNARDVAYWSEHGYLTPGVIPDHQWIGPAGTVAAFDCAWRESPVIVLVYPVALYEAE